MILKATLFLVIIIIFLTSVASAQSIQKSSNCDQFKLIVIPPDSATDYKLQVIKPDEKIDPRLIINPCQTSPPMILRPASGIIQDKPLPFIGQSPKLSLPQQKLKTVNEILNPSEMLKRNRQRQEGRNK